MKRDGFGHEKPGEGFTNEWLTPPGLLKRLGRIELDPCAMAPWVERRTERDSKGREYFSYVPSATRPSANSLPRPWPTAETMYSRLDDGLQMPWQGFVFCNPPYGAHVDKWAARMAEHRNGILLIFLRAETDAWREIFKNADGFLFPHGRVAFYEPDGSRAASGTAPSALVAYGPYAVEVLKGCGIAGAFFPRAEVLEGDKISTM